MTSKHEFLSVLTCAFMSNQGWKNTDSFYITRYPFFSKSLTTDNCCDFPEDFTKSYNLNYPIYYSMRFSKHLVFESVKGIVEYEVIWSVKNKLILDKTDYSVNDLYLNATTKSPDFLAISKMHENSPAENVICNIDELEDTEFVEHLKHISIYKQCVEDPVFLNKQQELLNRCFRYIKEQMLKNVCDNNVMSLIKL